MHRLLLLGLNHTTAPLEVRERLAFNADQRRAAVVGFRARFPGSEAVLLSTCNRVELYVARGGEGASASDRQASNGNGEPRPMAPTVDEMTDFLAAFHALPAGAFREHLYTKVDRGVVEHLFNVVSSLDSMVLGETQILGQVRESYDAARDVSAAGAMLHPLFQRALAVGKQVMHETALAEGRTSVASVAVDYARRIFDHFHDKTVLCVGAGKMAALALQGFAALSPRQLLVCNRDPAKAAALAARFNTATAKAAPVPFERLNDHLVAADIVVSSTGSLHPIITRAQFDAVIRQRRYRPVFLIDIAVPRDVEAAVGGIENVYLYNLDDLQQVVQSTQSQRRDAVEAARRIIARHVEEFAAWHRAREMGPLIDRLYRRCHQLAQDEAARTLPKLNGMSEADKAQVQELARRIVNKVLHQPVQTLKGPGAAHGPPVQHYLHAMEKLFGLGDGDASGRGDADSDAPGGGDVPPRSDAGGA